VTTPRVACVIPALNAAPTLASVIAGVRGAIDNVYVIAVDDGSSDHTGAVVMADADGKILFRRNEGKGAALRAGFAAALDQHAEIILTIDADGQHDPAFAPALISALETADVAIGARERTPNMPAGRRLTNRLSAMAVRYCVGRPIDDAQSGYRAIKPHVVAEIQPAGDRYEFETEFLILAARRGYTLSFVNIPTTYGTPVPSHFRPIRDSARIVKTLWRFGVGASP
jgi:glycosyltransferase involved in cell wall biosynthesis